MSQRLSPLRGFPSKTKKQNEAIQQGRKTKSALEENCLFSTVKDIIIPCRVSRHFFFTVIIHCSFSSGVANKFQFSNLKLDDDIFLNVDMVKDIGPTRVASRELEN